MRFATTTSAAGRAVSTASRPGSPSGVSRSRPLARPGGTTRSHHDEADPEVPVSPPKPAGAQRALAGPQTLTRADAGDDGEVERLEGEVQGPHRRLGRQAEGRR